MRELTALSEQPIGPRRAGTALGTTEGRIGPRSGIYSAMTGPGGNARLRELPTETVLGRLVPVARSGRARLFGLALLDLDAAGPGLLIPECRSIHSFWMRFPLAVYFLDRQGRAISCRPHLPPGRFAACREADAVLEIPVDPRSERPAPEPRTAPASGTKPASVTNLTIRSNPASGGREWRLPGLRESDAGST